VCRSATYGGIVGKRVLINGITGLFNGKTFHDECEHVCMSEQSTQHRDGIALTSHKPRGLPFLQPLYGLPPSQYTGDICGCRAYNLASRPADVRAGAGEMSFPDPADDAVARLRPITVTQALYGTMDDLYPETIRILHDLK
jgi:hypothetical protein